MVITGLSPIPYMARRPDEYAAGPMLCAGNELATAASKALGVDMKFENISQSVLSSVAPRLRVE